MSQVDVPDATSSRPEVEPAVSVVMSEGNQQDISMQENSSEQSSSLDGQLENLYPSLGPPPERWHEDLTFVLENLGRNYLTDMTTEFTWDVCQRLPSLVNTMVQSLSRISGCLLSARAIAFNYEDRSSVRAYSIITESIKNCINEQTNRDDVGMFMDLAFQYIGQGFEREPRRIFPVIYSSPFWKGRPILCPKHPNFYQRVAHLNNWLVRLRPWQGLKEVTWDEIAAVVAEGNPPPFAPERVPANLTWHLDPSQWSEENVNKLYDWILDHQHRLYAGDPEAERTALQFIEDTADEPFRKEPRFDAGEYDEHAAFYYQAMQHFRFHDDIYLPLTVTRPRWFTPTLLAAWEDILTPELRALFHFVELNQLLSPHERSSSPYDPPLLLQMPEQDGELNTFLNTFVVPSAVYRWDDEQYNRWNILSIWQFVGMRRSLVHEGGVAGGPTGAFRVAMALFVLHRLKHEFQAGRIPVTEGMINWGPTEDQQVQQISSTLMQQIQSRIDAVDRPTIYQGSVDDQWAPTHVILKIAGSEHDLQYDWPYGSFGKHQRLTWGMGNDDPVSLRGSSSNDGDVEADVPRASVSHFGDLASQSPTSRSHEGSSEPMVLSPPRMTPTDPVPTADVALTPLALTLPIDPTFVPIPATPLYPGRNLTQILEPPQRLPSLSDTGVVTIDSDDDNPWQPYRANLVRAAVPAPGRLPPRKGESSGSMRPSTEIIRTAPLPQMGDASLVRRSHSVDPTMTSQTPAGNLLGLQIPRQSGPSGAASGSGNTSFGIPPVSSTPHPPTRTTVTRSHGTQESGASIGEMRGSTRNRPPSSSGSHRSKTPIANKVHSRTASTNADNADQTVTGSLLDVAAKVFSQPEVAGTSSGETREPAVTTAPGRRIVTRHSAQAQAAAKRALPEEGSQTSARSKKSRSHEREGRKK